MLSWLTQFLAPPMSPSCTPEEMAKASFEAMKRREYIQLERAARLAQYARNWPSADDRPTNLYRFSREFRG